MDVMKLANSLPMWIACGIPVAFVMVQAILFAREAYRSGEKVGLTKTQMNKAMKSSAVTSIGPSIVVLSGMLSLLVTVGGPVGWMRLSMIGSVMFESIAAGLGTSAVGVTFSMPFEIGYMEVMQQVNTIVMNRTIRRFQIHQNGATILGSTTYKVQKIKKILQAVEVEMGFPAFLYDFGEQEGYCSSANFKRISEAYGLQESDYWNPKMEHNRYTLCDYIQMTRIRLCNEEHADGPRISWILIPISVGGNLQAYFVVMESREFLDYYDEYSIRIAYLLLKAVYEQIVIAQSIGNIGFENLVLLAMHSTGEDEERLLYIFQNSQLSKNAKLAFLDENAGIILIELSDSLSCSQEEVEHRILDFRQKIYEKFPEMELEFAMLREGKKMSEVKSSIETCDKVMKMGRKLYPKEKIWDYEMIGPFAWLQIPEEELEQMLSEYKKMMKDEKNVELLRTLKIYLESNMNFSVTAEKMYVHINTIRKRIDKLDRMLQIDWESHISRLKIEILLQFLEL